jgi:hypothetical protein
MTIFISLGASKLYRVLSISHMSTNDRFQWSLIKVAMSEGFRHNRAHSYCPFMINQKSGWTSPGFSPLNWRLIRCIIWKIVQFQYYQQKGEYRSWATSIIEQPVSHTCYAHLITYKIKKISDEFFTPVHCFAWSAKTDMEHGYSNEALIDCSSDIIWLVSHDSSTGTIDRTWQKFLYTLGEGCEPSSCVEHYTVAPDQSR